MRTFRSTIEGHGRRFPALSMHGAAGATVIELTVSLALMSTLALSGGAALQGALADMRLRTGANTLLLRLEHLRAMALLNAAEQTLLLEREGYSYSVNGGSGAKPPVNRRVALPIGVRIQSARFATLEGAKARVILRPDGSATPGTIVLRDEQVGACAVTLGLRGVSRLRCTND